MEEYWNPRPHFLWRLKYFFSFIFLQSITKKKWETCAFYYGLPRWYSLCLVLLIRNRRKLVSFSLFKTFSRQNDVDKKLFKFTIFEFFLSKLIIMADKSKHLQSSSLLKMNLKRNRFVRTYILFLGILKITIFKDKVDDKIKDFGNACVCVWCVS